MIETPKENKRKAAVRVIAEALAQAHPITAGLAHLYSFTHPSEMERAVEAWREEVTGALNDLEARVRVIEARIAPRLTIGENALALALWLAEGSARGMPEGVEFDDLRKAFPEIGKGDLEEACFELEHLGLIEVMRLLGSPVAEIDAAYPLFWTFDPIIRGTKPVDDARELAKAVIADASLSNMARLDAAIGWEPRRLNPAIARLVQEVTPGHVSRELQNRYPTSAFVLGSEDRFRLKRFINEGEG